MSSNPAAAVSEREFARGTFSDDEETEIQNPGLSGDSPEPVPFAIIGRIRNPAVLKSHGRGTLRAAFDLPRAEGSRGPIGLLSEIPEGNLRAYLVLVAWGATPSSAGAALFGVDDNTVNNWLREGKDPKCLDRMKREFYLRTSRFRASGRCDLEIRASMGDPIGTLKSGPIGRSDEPADSWTPRQQVQHANHDGTGPAELTFKVITREGGYGSQLLEEATEADS